jgi:hypothetical protein
MKPFNKTFAFIVVITLFSLTSFAQKSHSNKHKDDKHYENNNNYNNNNYNNNKYNNNYNNNNNYNSSRTIVVSDLAYKKAEYAYGELRNRGFNEVKRFQDKDGTYRLWYNDRTRQCIKTTSKYEKITYIRNATNCNL